MHNFDTYFAVIRHYSSDTTKVGGNGEKIADATYLHTKQQGNGERNYYDEVREASEQQGAQTRTLI